uniref:Secreted protein n=1 Tax=Romanomermis culicivorax TaxID=13658 RepID=A0A915L9V5_ROMCU
MCYPVCVISVRFLASAVVSALAPSPALPPLPLKYVKPVNLNPSMTPKTTGDLSIVASYRPTEGTLAPLACFTA